MKKIMSSFIGFVISLFLVSVVEARSAKIYRDYDFGMSKADIFQDKAVYDCSKEFKPGALCIEEHDFVGERVSVGFQFINDKLVSVSLISEFTESNYLTFMGALNSKFQMIQMESGGDTIDFVVQMKKLKESSFLKNISDFEQRAMVSGNVKYAFIDKLGFKKLIGKSDNAVEMIFKANSRVRAAEYIIATLNDNTAVGIIHFSVPKKTLKLMDQAAKKKYDDF